MDSIDNVVQLRESYRINGSIRRQDLHVLVVVESAIEIDLTALLSADLAIHHTAASVEPHLLTVGNQNLFDYFQLVV